MQSLRNTVTLIGHLGQDPETKDTGKSKLTKFSLATSENYKNEKGEKVTDTQWHSVTCWGSQAEIAAKYLKKGSEVAVQGKITYSNYEDKEGIKRFYTEINVRELLLLGKKDSGN